MREHHKRHEHHRQSRRHHRWPRHRGYSPEQWGSEPLFRRRFATRDERIARLETYLGELWAESKAVEEHIAELKAASDS